MRNGLLPVVAEVPYSRSVVGVPGTYLVPNTYRTRYSRGTYVRGSGTAYQVPPYVPCSTSKTGATTPTTMIDDTWYLVQVGCTYR
jgi:hypothetical protein